MLRGLTIGATAGFLGTVLLALWNLRNDLPDGTVLLGPGPALNLGITAAVLFGFRGRQVESGERSAVAIRLRNSVVGAGMLAVSLWAGYFLLQKTGWQIAGPDPSTLDQRRLEIPIFAGSIALLWFGGLDLIKQFSLRLVLKTKHGLPIRLRAMLDFFAMRALLSPVGTGYVFRHRQLLEHLAKQEDAASPASTETGST